MSFLETSAEYFTRGGLCMWPLLLCSFAVIFLAVERGIYYKQKISKTEFAVEFCEKMTRGQIEEAYNSISYLREDGQIFKPAFRASRLPGSHYRVITDAWAFGNHYRNDGDIFLHDRPAPKHGWSDGRFGRSIDYNDFRFDYRHCSYAGACLSYGGI